MLFVLQHLKSIQIDYCIVTFDTRKSISLNGIFNVNLDLKNTTFYSYMYLHLFKENIIRCN